MGIGLYVPPCPPAPLATSTNPSAPFSIAFIANLILITSEKTMPPYSCTIFTTGLGSPNEVITTGG